MLIVLLGLTDCKSFKKENEGGSTYVEFAGIVMVVALLVGGLLAAAPDLGREVSCKIIATIGGEGQCGAADDKAKEDKHKPTEPCVVNQRSQNLNVGGEGAVVGVEVNGGIVTEKLSNGHYRVTYKGGGKSGVVTGVGGGVEVTVDNQTYGENASAGASANLTEERGVTFEVDSEQAKNDLHKYFLREAASMTAGPLAKSAANTLLQLPNDYQPPKPKEKYHQLGVEGSASADATKDVAGAKVEAGAAAAIGKKVNLETGEETTYYKGNAQASGRVGAVGSGGGGEGSGEIVVAVTTKKDDPDKVLNVSASGTYNAQIGATTPLGIDNPDPLESGQIWTASVDLNSAETTNIAHSLLAATKVPGFDTGRGSGENVNDAVSTFINATADRGILTRQDVSKKSSKSGAQASVEEGLVASLHLAGTDETVEYSNGQYLSSDGKWKSREGC